MHSDRERATQVESGTESSVPASTIDTDPQVRFTQQSPALPGVRRGWTEPGPSASEQAFDDGMLLDGHHHRSRRDRPDAGHAPDAIAADPRQYVATTPELLVVLTVPDAHNNVAEARAWITSGHTPDHEAQLRVGNQNGGELFPTDTDRLAQIQYGNNHELPRAAAAYARSHHAVGLAGQNNPNPAIPGMAAPTPTALSLGTSIVWRDPADLAAKLETLRAEIIAAVGTGTYPRINVALFGHGGPRYLGGHGAAGHAGNSPQTSSGAVILGVGPEGPQQDGKPFTPEQELQAFQSHLYRERQTFNALPDHASLRHQRDQRRRDELVRFQTEVTEEANLPAEQQVERQLARRERWQSDEASYASILATMPVGRHHHHHHGGGGAPAAPATPTPSTAPTPAAGGGEVTQVPGQIADFPALGAALAQLMTSGGHVMFFACSTAESGAELDAARHHSHKPIGPAAQGQRGVHSADWTVLHQLEAHVDGDDRELEVAGHTTSGSALSNPHMRFFFGSNENREHGGVDISREDLLADKFLDQLAADPALMDRLGLGTDAHHAGLRRVVLGDAAAQYHTQEAWLLHAHSPDELRDMCRAGFQTYLETHATQLQGHLRALEHPRSH